MSVAALPVVLMPPTEDDREEEQRIAAKQDGSSSTGKKPSTWAAVTRALFGSLAFLFKRPIRLFRPVKISTWTGIQAIAEEQGRSVTPGFVRALLRKEGWRFFPRHVLPPLLVNTAVGLTLFTCYTGAESLLTPLLSNSLSPTSTFLLVPFLSGSFAGGAQSLLSAPLDNARLLLLRRQRLLRQYGRRNLARHGQGAGTAFTSWWGLMRDAVFQSSILSGSRGKADTTAAGRVQQGRQWARRGWSLWGLSLSKDAVCFGVFFTIFEVGREGARRVGLAWDGITVEERIPSVRRDEAGDDEEYSDDWDGGTRKRSRSIPSLVLQSFLILLSGGVAGFCFALVARPFERARAAIWEGRSRWAERDGRLRVIEELALKGAEAEEVKPERGRRRYGKSNKHHPSAKRRAVRIQVTKRRGVGRTFVIAKRRQLKAKAFAAAKALHRHELPADASSSSSTPSPSPRPPRPRQPMPSAISLVTLAARRYGVRNFFLAPLPVLKRQEARLSSMQSSMSPEGVLQPPIAAAQPKKMPVKVGPTRLSARGREVGKAMKATGGWRRGAALLAYIPPYAVGFFAYAMMSGDLR
ncbi:hypothetical protein BCR35DRAFT_292044 [Leucosporidium creatinivorum]|uniref:Mitochondrial carrier domain-containing protein n=1 Tax=Leucosporidium creatinivorum TaxID=106004 RepID=A0A1Y2F2F3_9BASI|nr:hypothetical protein BCR35DRAFT_292044 [Leucosporidium creatinivorum]